MSRFIFPYVYPIDVTTITENTVFLLLCNSTFHISQVTICEGLFMDSCVSLIYLSLLTPIIHCLNLSKICSFSSTLYWLFWAFFHLHINLSSLSISRKKACWDFDRDSTEFINLGRNCIFITEFSNLWIWDIPLFTVSQFISGMLSFSVLLFTYPIIIIPKYLMFLDATVNLLFLLNFNSYFSLHQYAFFKVLQVILMFS